MSAGQIEAYQHDGRWIIVRNLRWLGADRHSFESWTGAEWSEQIGRSKRFDTQADADQYIGQNHEQLLGATMA